MKNKKWMRNFFTPSLLTILVTGCGIAGTGGPSRTADDTQGETPKEGQAVLGPIIGASVSVRDIDNPDDVACSTTTTDNDDLSRAGAIAFNKPCVFADHLYLVTVSGGMDVDFNDDGIRDATPTPNTGEFRALLTGAQMLQNDWHVNALTEVAYQGIQYALAQGMDNIGTILDGVAQLYIQTDLNNDGVVNRLDITLWDPVNNAEAVFNLDKLNLSTLLIHQNLNRTLDDVPASIALEARIDTLAPARQVLNLDDVLLVTTDSALLVYRQADSVWQLDAHLTLGWVYDMALKGKTLYVALGDNGIAAIDVSDAGNPKVQQRWNFAARRITTLGEHVLFSFRNEEGGLQLREIDADQSRLIADSNNAAVDRLRAFSKDDTARNGILKTLGDTLFWSTQGTLHAFTFQDGAWTSRQLLRGIPEFTYQFDIIDDIEINDNIAYVVVRRVDENMVQFIVGMPQYLEAADEIKFDGARELIGQKRVVSVVDISDIENPTIITDVENEDIETVRRWDDSIVALGTHSISARNAVDMKIDAQIALPSSFSGFEPVHGLTRIGGSIAVAARENGVLLLKPPVTQAHLYSGHVIAQAPVSGATVTVTQLNDNQQTCVQTTTADGAVTIPSDCLMRPGYYLLSASGGTQVVEGNAQPVTGEMRSVMLASTIAGSGWNITPLTELALRVAQTGDGDGFDAFTQSQDDIADWFLGGVPYPYSTTLDALALFGWQPDTTLGNLPINPQHWREASTAISNGSFNNSMLASLMAPVTNMLAFDERISDLAISESALFVAHANSIDIVDRTVTPWRRSTIHEGAQRLYLRNDTLIAVNSHDALINFYSLANPDNIQRVASVSIPGFSKHQLAQVCVSANMLYQIADDPADNDFRATISAWRITETGVTALTPLQVGVQVFAYALREDLRCNDTVLAGRWSTLAESIDVFHVDGNNLEHTATLNALPVYGFDLKGSRLTLYGVGNTADSLSVYNIENNGDLQLAEQVEVALKIDTIGIVATRVESTGGSIAVRSMDNITLFDANTLQQKGSLPLNFNGINLRASDEDLWMWGYGFTVWQVKMAVEP